MATKLDYLKDLSQHTHSTGGEAAARLDVPEATILEAYRRARRQGLVVGDGRRPEKFMLTDAGLQQLANVQGESDPTPDLPRIVEDKLSALEEKVNETIENVKGLSGLVDQVLSTKGGQRTATAHSDDVGIVEDLLDERKGLEEKLTNTARAIEYYATQLGLADFESDRNLLESRGTRLAQQLDSESRQAVLRLLEIEEQLSDELSRFFGPHEDRVRKVLGEIAALRKKLGFVPMDFIQERGGQRE